MSLRVHIAPTAEQIPADNGVGRVVHAQYRYLPEHGIELVDDPREADMLAAQRYSCCICHREFSSDVKPHIDHCHTTGKVRGILCSRCNHGLGFFRDSTLYLRNAIHYLKRNGSGLLSDTDRLLDATSDTLSDENDEKLLRETPTEYIVQKLGFG